MEEHYKNHLCLHCEHLNFYDWYYCQKRKFYLWNYNIKEIIKRFKYRFSLFIDDNNLKNIINFKHVFPYFYDFTFFLPNKPIKKCMYYENRNGKFWKE